jgi:NADH dehydrogenase/NADH:ubiquinone oxidoreductase subunit G
MRCLQCVCPSNGACDLQKLGVEYGVTSNDLVVPGARIRAVEPQYEHPFIRRDMDRCIACGRCVRVCRDVAGPACYDFTGRGFMMNVDTPYGEALQLAENGRAPRLVLAGDRLHIDEQLLVETRQRLAQRLEQILLVARHLGNSDVHFLKLL